ncbi:MAG: rane protein [Solirubrobacteraceae bacterium]|nr:rane protein [Solirubrobacteraceae bacterium]
MILMAKALAFSAFLAIPSVLLVAVGAFTLVGGPKDIDQLIVDLHGHVPAEARDLLARSLRRLDSHSGQSVGITVVGLGVALVSLTSAMENYMTALDVAFDRADRRSFLKRRLVALQMVGSLGAALLLIAGLLALGHDGAEAAGGVAVALWDAAFWPVVLAGLLAGFAAMLYLGPDVEERSLRLVRPGALVAAVTWTAASGALWVYSANFDHYNKTWGSLSAVIVVLTWLWFGSFALLFGAELDSEVEAVP